MSSALVVYLIISYIFVGGIYKKAKAHMMEDIQNAPEGITEAHIIGFLVCAWFLSPLFFPWLFYKVVFSR